MEDESTRVMDTLLRMIVPFRREFRRMLDVKHFLHDFEYRQEIIAQALQSREPRLRESALYLQRVLAGPRVATDAVPQGGAAAARGGGHPSTVPAGLGPPETPFLEHLEASAAPASKQGDGVGDDAEAAQSAEERLRAQILRKYTGGLR